MEEEEFSLKQVKVPTRLTFTHSRSPGDHQPDLGTNKFAQAESFNCVTNMADSEYMIGTLLFFGELRRISQDAG